MTPTARPLPITSEESARETRADAKARVREARLAREDIAVDVATPIAYNPLLMRLAVRDEIATVGHRLCCYYHADPAAWAVETCDCKRGGPTEGGGEQTGCPEMRDAYRALDWISDDEWAAANTRALEHLHRVALEIDTQLNAARAEGRRQREQR